jgi:hypothetical protein
MNLDNFAVPLELLGGICCQSQRLVLRLVRAVFLVLELDKPHHVVPYDLYRVSGMMVSDKRPPHCHVRHRNQRRG